MINKRATFKVNIEQINGKWSSLLEILQEHRQEHHKRMSRSPDFEAVFTQKTMTNDNTTDAMGYHNTMTFFL